MELAGTRTEAGEPMSKSGGKPHWKRDRSGQGYFIIKQVLMCLAMAGMACGSFGLIQRYVLQTVRVIGPSMSPTLLDSNRYLLNRLVYSFREPKPEDIVVLRDPQDNGFVIKRIVAKPGDSVYVKGGQIFVNGKLLNEPYLKPDTKTFPGPEYSAEYWICGANRYFVLGDNRNNSADSRIYGAVPRQNILGMVSP